MTLYCGQTFFINYIRLEKNKFLLTNCKIVNLFLVSQSTLCFAEHFRI